MKRLAVSISSTSRRRIVPMMTLSAVGSAPPASEVPAPRGTTLTPSRWQTPIAAATSAVERGSATASGGQRYAVSASHS